MIEIHCVHQALPGQQPRGKGNKERLVPLGSYVPGYLRNYPFALLPQQGTDRTILCVDSDSGLVIDGGAAGEDFVGPDGNISPALKKVLDFLNELERSRKATDMAVAALAGAGVIQP